MAKRKNDTKYHEVLKVMKRNITEDLLKFVTYENNSFIVTQNHPILTDVSAMYDFETKREFMPAMLFKTGDKLFSPDNHIYCIKDIQKINMVYGISRRRYNYEKKNICRV